MGIQVVYDSLQSGAQNLRSGPANDLGTLKIRVTDAKGNLTDSALEHDGVAEQAAKIEDIASYFENDVSFTVNQLNCKSKLVEGLNFEMILTAQEVYEEISRSSYG